MVGDRERADVGVVAIGRDEGERLIRCLESVRHHSGQVVYVDSGSSDDSVEKARELGVEVILERTQPFSAACARNTGFDRLRDVSDDELRYVQFIDGDCEMWPGWIPKAAELLDERPDIGVVTGRVRERCPAASVYNKLADMEWNVPIGEVEACGGNAMIRSEALLAAGLFNPSLIAGEEPELHLRIRRAGYRIWRLADEMVLHDIAMTSWRQWWRRMERAGHAYAEAVHLHGREPERFRVRELRSILLWGGALPMTSAALAPPSLGLSLWGLLMAYGLLWSRIYRSRRRQDSDADAMLYATSCALGKLPQMQGAVRFGWTRFIRRRSSQIIEHKKV